MKLFCISWSVNNFINDDNEITVFLILMLPLKTTCLMAEERCNSSCGNPLNYNLYSVWFINNVLKEGE